MGYTQTKTSALWQRMGAARARAGMSQLAVSKAMGSISRAAVALWESQNDDLRTMPSSEQLMKFAQVVKIPAELLVDDHVSATGIQMLPIDATAAQVAALRGGVGASAARAQAPDGSAARARVFWSTVRLTVMERDSTRGQCFDVVVERNGLVTHVPYLRKRTLVFMLAQLGRDREQFLRDELPGLLFARALASKSAAITRILVLGDPGTGAELDGQVIEHDLVGCDLVGVSSVETAATALLEP
jgi:transcriptional regulator with XRE-family HTH domain